ncbi:MAG: hypothetical protein ACI8ZM_002417 [Crocinitomix sp.]|jgi:hypothetical protein
MKNILWILGIVLLFSSCKDKIHQKYLANSPVYTDYEAFRNSGGFEAAKSIEQQGNIYFKDDFLFMVEPDKGIHFIDNTNPTAPVQAGFLNIWGATGMAIKGNYLYANSFIDMVVYDISSFANPTLVERLEDVFPGALPFSEKNYPYRTIDKSKGVVTSWTVEEVTEEIANSQPTWIDCFNCEVNFSEVTSTFNSGSSSGGGSSTGVSGSISLFTIIDDYLYVVENGSLLHPFEISSPASPTTNDPVYLWGDVETLFPYNEYIFMGTPSGMLVYETSNPTEPTFVSSLSHARGCDPVVVQDDYAYVTVRSGGPCGGDINQLDVIDISSIASPVLKASFNLKNPHGLGVDGTSLFVCDGEDGLKVFDATNPETAGDNKLHQFKNIQATDIIPVNGIAIVIGEDGIFQYDYSDLSNITLLSSLNF